MSSQHWPCPAQLAMVFREQNITNNGGRVLQVEPMVHASKDHNLAQAVTKSLWLEEGLEMEATGWTQSLYREEVLQGGTHYAVCETPDSQALPALFEQLVLWMCVGPLDGHSTELTTGSQGTVNKNGGELAESLLWSDCGREKATSGE